MVIYCVDLLVFEMATSKNYDLGFSSQSMCSLIINEL